MCIETTREMLQASNRFLERSGGEALFDVHLVGLDRSTCQSTGCFTVNSDMLLADVQKTGLILIPAVYGDQEEVLAENREIISWIRERAREGAAVASFCTGAHLLAATGLLDGKQCTTHWLYADSFRRMFASARLMDDRVVTEEGGLYTSGGAFSSPNLLLHLIEKYAGREIAVLVAKTYAIDIDRRSQSAYMIFQGQRAHGDESVKVVQDYIETHVGDGLRVEELSRVAGVGRRSLERRFRSATGSSIAEYILRVRIEAAKRLLESGRDSVFEVMFKVGYADPDSFRTTFKRVTGTTPLHYRKRFRKPVRSDSVGSSAISATASA